MTDNSISDIITFDWPDHCGDIHKMNGALLLCVEAMQNQLSYNNQRIVMHAGYAETGHAKGSEHYKGNAVDFHIEGLSTEKAFDFVQDVLVLLQIINRCGLGFYPQWNNPGFHLDLNGRKKRWGWLNGQMTTLEKAHTYMIENRGNK